MSTTTTTTTFTLPLHQYGGEELPVVITPDGPELRDGRVLAPALDVAAEELGALPAQSTPKVPSLQAHTPKTHSPRPLQQLF